MAISKSKNRNSAFNFRVVDNIVFNTASKIQNGSIKIIKQDNIIIQININEKIIINNTAINDEYVKEVLP